MQIDQQLLIKGTDTVMKTTINDSFSQKKLNKSDKKNLIYYFGFLIALLCVSDFALAEDDLLSGTTTQALATLNGAGRNWAYILTGVFSVGSFITTKNPFVFFSVLGVGLFLTILYKMAGGS